jgi:hypothetical protein
MYAVRGLGDISQAELDAAGVTPAAVAALNDVYGPNASAVSGSGQVVFTPVPQTLTQWLNQNATSIAIAAAVGVGVLLFAKAGR